MFRWGNQQREVYLNLLITGKRAEAQPISVTLAGFSRVWADEKAQPLGSRWHFHVYYQNAKLVNEFLTRSVTAWTAQAESKQKKMWIKGIMRDQGLLILAPKHPNAGLGCSEEEGTVKGKPDGCSFQKQFILLPIRSDSGSLIWGKWPSQMGDNGSFLELCKE